MTLARSVAPGATSWVSHGLESQFLRWEWLAGACRQHNTSFALQDGLSKIYPLKHCIYQLNLSAEMPHTSGEAASGRPLDGKDVSDFLARGTEAAQPPSPTPASHSRLHFIWAPFSNFTTITMHFCRRWLNDKPQGLVHLEYKLNKLP